LRFSWLQAFCRRRLLSDFDWRHLPEYGMAAKLIMHVGAFKVNNAEQRLTKTLRLGLRSSPVVALDVDAFFPRDRKCRAVPIMVTPSLIRSSDTVIKDAMRIE
jgi:hypothetical protein